MPGGGKSEKNWGKKLYHSEYLGSPDFGYTKVDVNMTEGFSKYLCSILILAF